jgi:hypothetical protein
MSLGQEPDYVGAGTRRTAWLDYRYRLDLLCLSHRFFLGFPEVTRAFTRVVASITLSF